MTETHDIGKLFWHTTRVNRISWPLAHGETQEVEPPYRKATPWVFHMPGFKFAVVIGVWKETDLDEDEALVRAMRVGLDRPAPTLEVGEASVINPAVHRIIWPHGTDRTQIEREAAIRFIDQKVIDPAENALVKDILGLTYAQAFTKNS